MDEYFNFKCKQCGTCCKKSLVSMTYFEHLRFQKLAQKLGKICVFFIYKNHADDWVILLSAKPCPFLDKENKCIIYEDRSIKCRMHPFNTTNNEDIFQENDCPGWDGEGRTKVSEIKKELVPYFKKLYHEYDKSNETINELIDSDKLKLTKLNRKFKVDDREFDLYRFKIKK